MPSGWVSHPLGGSPKCISALSLPSGTVGAPSKPDNDATRGRTRPTVPPPDPAAMGTWKFFRASVDGRPVFKKEFDKLPDQARAALIVLMQRYLVGDLAAGSIKPIRGDILELRWHEANNHFRVLFFRWGQHPVALTAFYKNQQKTPKTKIETALDRQKIWKRAFGDTPPI